MQRSVRSKNGIPHPCFYGDIVNKAIKIHLNSLKMLKN